MAARRAPASKTSAAPLEHPHQDGIDRLRKAILGIDPRIVEEVKWNAPSFKLAEHFATFKLHPPKQIQLVLHTGSKPIVPVRQFKLDAPPGLLKWAAPDRCVITLASSADALKYEAEVVGLVRQWIAQL